MNEEKKVGSPPVEATSGDADATRRDDPTASTASPGVGASASDAAARRTAGVTQQSRFSLYLLLSAGLAALLAALFTLYVSAQLQVNRANEQRYRSYLLADELRQSSDDLTRVIRAYASTGDPVYKQRFQDILDIREGRKPRPENPERPYWDLVLGHGPLPRPNQQAIPLLQLMREAGFTRQEFDKLALAKANSDALTKPEFEAMRLIETGGSQAGENRLRATSMLFDSRYMAAKASAMKPIDDFMALLDQRTLAAVRAAQSRARLLRYLFVAIGLALVFSLWRSYVALLDTLGGSLGEVATEIARIGSGDFSSVIAVKAGRENSVLGWLASTRDRSADMRREREHADNALRDTEEFNRSIIESCPDCLKVLDLDANLLSISQGGQRLLEIQDINRYLGQCWLSFWQPADQPDIRAALATARAGGEGHFRAYSPTEAGNPRWWDVIVTPIRDKHGAVRQLLSVSREISAQLHAEAALRESEQQLKLIADTTPALISWIGNDLCYRSVNKSYERWFGKREEELRGRAVRDVLGEAAWEVVRPHMEQALAGVTVTLEQQIPYRDGGTRWVHVTYTPSRDAAGRVSGFVEHVMDIGEIKLAQAEIQYMNATLEQRVAQRTAALNAANQDLESFSYSVSHDLRAPLRAIDNFSQILLEDYSPVLDAEGQRLLSNVRRNTEKMDQLIRDSLAFSRAGRRELALTDVDVAALCRQVVGELLPTPGRRIEVHIGELPRARADAALLRQALVNLLSNAIKFTGTREQAEIDITGSASADQVTYSIRDNGVGFNPDYAHKLFGVFQRLHGDSEFPGTGIGLAIVKRVIDKLGGRVWAEGQVDCGATFHISLPGSAGATTSGAPP